MKINRLTVRIVFLVCIIVNPSLVRAIGFDKDDFIISAFTSGNIGVFDSDFTFKGYLDADFPTAAGLDFDSQGHVIAVGHNNEIRIYDSTGNRLQTLNIGNPEGGEPIDLKVGPDGNYYVGNQSLLREISPAGAALRQFNIPDVAGVVTLPNGVLWGGSGNQVAKPGYLQPIDLSTGGYLGTIPLNGGQQDTISMRYSDATNTVLMTQSYGMKAVFERSLNGDLIRTYSLGGPTDLGGVTRGPGGGVYALGLFTNRAYKWDPGDQGSGSLFELSPLVTPINILWAGNAAAVPEPAAMALVLIGCASTNISRRRRPTSHNRV
jgi:hypothetical protein